MQRASSSQGKLQTKTKREVTLLVTLVRGKTDARCSSWVLVQVWKKNRGNQRKHLDFTQQNGIKIYIILWGQGKWINGGDELNIATNRKSHQGKNSIKNFLKSIMRESSGA